MIDRISVLGGSSVYIPELILSMISHNLNVKEIVLVGRPGKKLPLVAAFCQRLLNKSGFPAKIIGVTDIDEGVAGAKYILNHVRVGGMQARLWDEKLPPRFGMIGDETLGAGALTNALRTLPVLFDFAEHIERVNPEATVINITNPLSICVEALTSYTNLKVAGVCDLPGTYCRRIAQLLHADPADISMDYIGLNHIGFVQDVKVEGHSMMARVLDKLDHQREDGFDYDLIELFRMIPTCAENLCFHRDRVLKRQQACALFRAEVLHEAEQQILKLYEDEHLAEVPELTRARNAVWYEEVIVPLLCAMESNKEHEIILCIRNDDCIRDLPESGSVEVPVRVSRRGLKPRKVGSCPRFLKGLFLAVKESDRLTVEAARHKSYDCALQALAVNPLVPSTDSAREYLDYVIKEQGIELH